MCRSFVRVCRWQVCHPMMVVSEFQRWQHIEGCKLERYKNIMVEALANNVAEALKLGYTTFS